MTTKRVWSNVAIPPGETLSEELDARGLTQKALAQKMGRPLQAVNEIVLGKKAITAETALQLEAALDGPSAEFWMNLESGYQLTKARIAVKAAAARPPLRRVAARAASTRGFGRESARRGAKRKHA